MLIQGVSESVVPTRTYQYTFNDTTSPVETFRGVTFEIELCKAEDGQKVVVSVMFRNGPCNSMLTVTYNGKISHLVFVCVCGCVCVCMRVCLHVCIQLSPLQYPAGSSLI